MAFSGPLLLYNYGARFYSAKLGRFLSADPVGVMGGDPQALDRYAYVRNNPLKYVDPTGLTFVGVGGWNMYNEKGYINKRDHNFEGWVKQYWKQEFGPNFDVDTFWYWLGIALAAGRPVDAIIGTFDVAFFDTAGKGYFGAGGAYSFDVNAAVGGLSGFIDEHNVDVTLMVGYSFGGVVVHDYIWKITRGMEGPTGFDVILIQPALKVFRAGNLLDPWRDDDPRWGGWNPFDAGHPELHASEWGGRIVTVNQAGGIIGGKVWGAKDFTFPRDPYPVCDNSGLHCAMNAVAPMVMNWLYP